MDYLIYLLLVVLLFQAVLAYKERQSLVDRLMARDLSDFKANSEPEEENVYEDDDELADLEEAKEEIAHG